MRKIKGFLFIAEPLPTPAKCHEKIKINIMVNTCIEWNQAQQISVNTSEQKEVNQKKAINEFLTSNHELSDAHDLQYYQTETGKPMSWIIENAKGLNPTIAAALNSGFSIDDLSGFNF